MKSRDQLAIQHRELAADGPVGQAIKSILFVVHEDDALEARLQAALSLARACSAHLQLLHVVPIEAYTVVDLHGGTFVSGEIVEALQDEAASIRRRLEDRLGSEDVSWSYDVTTSVITSALLRNAAFADLMVIGRQPHDFGRPGPGLLGALVCTARTPLCIPGDDMPEFDPLGTALIAWNGSVEAANAVRSSIGLLKLASDVLVVRCEEETDASFPDTRLLEYLSRHGVHSRLDVRTLRQDLADDLIEYAGVYCANYIVMGGYSHSRMGEFLFGGVTRALLQECPISLVMAH